MRSSLVRSILAVATAVLSGALIFGLPACESRGHAGEGDADGSSEGASSDQLESEGDACSRDPDCSGYLRCFDGTCQVPPAITGDATATTPRVTFHDESRSTQLASFHVEVASNPAQRRRGLMFRREMRPDWGMLFVYPREARRSFWMKNTHIPLDMVFLDASGRVVHVVHRAEPRSTEQRSSRRPARYVVELNAGTASNEGISAGSVMTVEHLPERYTPSQ